MMTPGTKLGPYEIIAPLGAGGMGEVYRAKDTRLGREVAVKVLPQHLSSNPEIRARFEREAKTVSSLNHPHICTLHDVGCSGDVSDLRVSSGGDKIAFFAHPTRWDDRGEVMVVDVAGHHNVCGTVADRASRCFALDLAGGAPRPVTPEGTTTGIASPDGKTIIAVDSSGRYVSYPEDGAASHPVPGMKPGERIAHWSTDGRSILVGALSTVPVHIDRLMLATGARTPFVELAPVDRSGALYSYEAAFSEDERAYAYSVVRDRSYLYEVSPAR